uniref:Putative glycosyl hydrolase n=1 Tax=Chrysomela lapponica TaxID=153811 RepID=A0A0B5EDK8_CHRLA|nr:putative glycosyl hydrolase [Chrysomela lapponica]
MRSVIHFVFFFIIVFNEAQVNGTLNNKRFPDDFKFGVATASYQVEGAWNEDGKGENVWDQVTHRVPSPIVNNDTGDVACDSYHKYKEDVAMLKDLGVDFYRFSISWSRILPTGFANEINEAGLQYYKNLVKELRANGIEPLVTIFHWDQPQPLEDLGGWTNDIIIDQFVDYARILFRELGNEVKYWLTFNEPKQTCNQGYGTAQKAPLITSPGMGEYLCTHNLLRAHAKAWRLYDEEFRQEQQGTIGITIDTPWFEPFSNSTADIEAAETKLQFTFGWYTNPIVYGDYPSVMQTNIARRSAQQGFKESRLPQFTEEEKAYIKGTYDFLGVNVYTTFLVSSTDEPDPSMGLDEDSEVLDWQPDDWESTASSWLKVVPWGMRKLVTWIKNTYDNPKIMITENGYSDNGTLEDDGRISYYERYLSSLRDAMELDGVDVIAYTAWSLMDNFEWMQGYSEKFGLYHVDFNSPNRERTAKKSALWYKNLLETRCLVEECVD